MAWPPAARAIFPCRRFAPGGVSIHIPPEVETEPQPGRNISPPHRWSPGKGTHHPAAYKNRSLAAAVEAKQPPSSVTPAAAASHAGRAAAAAADAAAAIRSAAVVGTLEMASSCGGAQQQQGGEARARLKWTRDLHDRFGLAVAQLGGADSKSPPPWRAPSSAVALPLALISDHDLSLSLWHCRGDAQVRPEGHGRAGAHALPPQEPPPGAHTSPAAGKVHFS